MIKAVKATRRINSFRLEAIPSGRDLYYRYGERTGTNGDFLCEDGEVGLPVSTATSTIGRIMAVVDQFSQDPINQ